MVNDKIKWLYKYLLNKKIHFLNETPIFNKTIRDLKIKTTWERYK